MLEVAARLEVRHKEEMLRFDNTYARLPARFYARVMPAQVREPRVIQVNPAMAELLGADPRELASAAGAQVLAGNVVPEGAEPIALAYAGHQFGTFVHQLGDGRAILLGEVVGEDGVRRDVQLKGSGPTPFSRRGDGRAALGPVLREYVVSEAMAALGIPTTRALAAVTTGEVVRRETRLPGAILTRVASSHLRVGTFEYFAARDDREALAALASYALARHYPDAQGTGNDALALLERVILAQATLVARWMGVGFIHGVMNTDNTSISGETIDYGPCAFLDEYDPRKAFSSIDHGGRYAFGNQPHIALWNLARFAETLLPLISTDDQEAIDLASSRLERFTDLYESAHTDVFSAKLGLDADEGARPLVAELLLRMARNQVDFTLFFHRLATDPDRAGELFADRGVFDEWAERWRAVPRPRLAEMKRVSPAFIPRNHRVEEVIAAAVAREDFAPFEELLSVVTRPYDDQPENAAYMSPPSPEERVRATFCGT
jgi:serine/tyrosine/threonine adenylyltransferase